MVEVEKESVHTTRVSRSTAWQVIRAREPSLPFIYFSSHRVRCPFKWECWCWLRNTGAGSLLISALVNFTLFPLHFPCPGGGSARLSSLDTAAAAANQHGSGRVGTRSGAAGGGRRTGCRGHTRAPRRSRGSSREGARPPGAQRDAGPAQNPTLPPTGRATQPRREAGAGWGAGVGAAAAAEPLLGAFCMKMAAPTASKAASLGCNNKPAFPELDFRSGARVEELNKLIQEFTRHDQREYDDQRALEIHTAKDFIFSMLGKARRAARAGRGGGGGCVTVRVCAPV